MKRHQPSQINENVNELEHHKEIKKLKFRIMFLSQKQVFLETLDGFGVKLKNSLNPQRMCFF